ncbi:type 1 glutamine amidotransferase [Leucobacter sp. BZR 635]
MSAGREQHTHAILVLQPDGNCGPDRIATWSAEHGIELNVYNMSESTKMPASLDGYDGLIVLGGDMGDRDTAEYPWLEDMRERLREAHRNDVPALGVCLGAQLLASALGGEVELGEPGLETGVVGIRVTEEGAGDPLMQGVSDVFHSGSMHNDAVVRLPQDAVLLASGDVYPNQAFRSGSTWAVQFHPEVSPASYEMWVGLEDHSANPELQARFDASVADFWRRDDLVAPECERLVSNFLNVVKSSAAVGADGASPQAS